ncbi:MAG: hypothetical protein WD906_07900 [Anaerolineales bacterium]
MARLLAGQPAIAALAVFVPLTIVWTWPLLLHLQTAVLGQIGDNVYFIWLIRWVQESLARGQLSVTVPTLNYPEGWSLAYTEMTPTMVLTALPFSWVAGPTFAYNAAVMLSFPLSGWAAFAWARRHTAGLIAPLIAGVIFGFSPLRFSHALAGHLNLLGTAWIPWFFLGLSDVLGLRRWSWGPILRTAAFFILIAWTSQYLLYMTSILAIVYVIGYLLCVDASPVRSRVFWGRLISAGLLSVPLVLVSLLPYVALARQGSLPERPLGYVRTYSASITDFFLPSTTHFAWGRWVGEHFNRDLWIEATLYLGAAALILSIAAYLWRKINLAGPRQTSLLVLFAAAAIVLAMGTDVHWLSRPVEVRVPGLGGDSFPLVLPGYFLFRFLPFYSAMRVAMRYGVFALLAVSVLAAIGADTILGRVGRAVRPWAGMLILSLVVIDFLPRPQPLAAVSPRPVDLWLADHPGAGAVVQLPISQSQDQEQIYYTLFHHRPFVGGFFNAFPPPQYVRITPALETFPSPSSVETLKDLNVEYAIVDGEEYPELLQGGTPLGLEFEIALEGQLVYRVVP